jgi:predicted acylesterase/phospholipase RssA
MSAAGSLSASKAVVLALGCGGTRGFAHIGVIKSLLDAGFPIEGIAGVSAGALFGALFAIDGRVESVLEAMTATPMEIAGFYRDRLRLAASNPLGLRLANRFADLQIESLAVPLSIVTMDLETGDDVVLRSGSLLSAVGASIAIPVLARPVELGGRPLIDGGYGLASTVQAARDMGDGVVVEVNLGVQRRLPRALEKIARGAMSRIRAGRARFSHARCTALGFGTLLLGQHETQLGSADLVIAPSLTGFIVHSPFAGAKAFRRGEQAALAALPQLRELLTARTDRPAPAIYIAH